MKFPYFQSLPHAPLYFSQELIELWISKKFGTEYNQVGFNYTIVDPKTYSFGRQDHLVGQFRFQIYSPARTVADCFKFRSKVADADSSSGTECGEFSSSLAISSSPGVEENGGGTEYASDALSINI